MSYFLQLYTVVAGKCQVWAILSSSCLHPTDTMTQASPIPGMIGLTGQQLSSVKTSLGNWWGSAISTTSTTSWTVRSKAAQLDFTFAEEPPVPAEMMDGLKPEELAQPDPLPGGSDPAPTFSWEFENKESLVINGEILTGGSSMVLLRAAADYLGVSQGRQDAQRKLEVDEERRAIPSIQLDYCFSKTENSEKVTTVLTAIDCESKYVTVYPLPSKGHNLKSQAEHLVRFSMSLDRCLPGQRNAAARFLDFLCEHLQSLEFENTLLLPSLFRHKSRNLVICSHVDDLVLCGERPDLEWLVKELKKRFNMQGGEILPSADQDPHEPIRFLKKRHFFTEAGIVISPHEKYTEELLKLYGLESRKAKATPDMACENYESPELNEEGKHTFRSAMGTLLYLSRDRVDLQHAVRHLSQFMAKPTTAAEAGVKHVIQYLKGTTELGILLSYNVQKSKLDEVRGKPDGGYVGDLVEAFTDADWAGEVQDPEKEAFSFLCNGVCEQSFGQFLGVGRLKHVDTKFLWLQQKIKEGDLDMDGVATVLNISDLGTKKLPKIRRCFLMHLLGLVEYDPSVKQYVTVGEEEFNTYMQEKYMGQSMKTVRRVVLDTLSTGADEITATVSKPLVKALTIFSLQPLAAGSRMGDEMSYEMMVKNYGYIELFLDFPTFMLAYALTFLVVGIAIGYFLKNAIHKLASFSSGSFEFCRAQTTLIVEVDGGLARFVKFDRKRRRHHGFDEIDPLNAYDLSDGEEGEEEPMEVDETLPVVAENSALMAHAELYGAPSSSSRPGALPAGGGHPGMPGDEAAAGTSDSATREYNSLPGSLEGNHEPPTLPLVGVDWNDVDVILQYFPVIERARALQVREVGLFSATVLQKYLKVHLVTLCPGQLDMLWDYPAFWTRGERHGFTVFCDIVLRGMYLNNWGSFVEHWFIQQDVMNNLPGPAIPWGDDD
eukprot:s2794_g2.t1